MFVERLLLWQMFTDHLLIPTCKAEQLAGLAIPLVKTRRKTIVADCHIIVLPHKPSNDHNQCLVRKITNYVDVYGCFQKTTSVRILRCIVGRKTPNCHVCRWQIDKLTNWRIVSRVGDTANSFGCTALIRVIRVSRVRESKMLKMQDEQDPWGRKHQLLRWDLWEEVFANDINSKDMFSAMLWPQSNDWQNLKGESWRQG